MDDKHSEPCGERRTEALAGASLLERAIAIAVERHAGATDKAGRPYILHPLRVMLRMPSDELRIVAVLHDVLEDCGVTAEDLRHDGFPEPIVEALVALTKRDGEGYMDFVARAAANRLARQVKHADLLDNLDPERLARLDEEEAGRRRAKYQPALDWLCAVNRADRS